MPDYLPHIDQPHKLEHGKKPSNAFRDWSCRVRFAMHELGENFVVLFFVGDVPEDPTQWDILVPTSAQPIHTFRVDARSQFRSGKIL